MMGLGMSVVHSWPFSRDLVLLVVFRATKSLAAHCDVNHRISPKHQVSMLSGESSRNDKNQ